MPTNLVLNCDFSKSNLGFFIICDGLFDFARLFFAGYPKPSRRVRILSEELGYNEVDRLFY